MLFTSKHLRVILVGCAVFAGGIGIGAFLGGSEEVPDLIQKGDAAYASKKWEETLAFYEEAAKIKPNSNELDKKIRLAQAKLKESQEGTGSGHDPKPASNETNARQEPAPSVETKNAVPNLVGLTRSEAEKLLLSKGMRYQYFIERSNAEAEKVFKQDKQPGQPYVAGERITFYVSAGK